MNAISWDFAVWRALVIWSHFIAYCLPNILGPVGETPRSTLQMETDFNFHKMKYGRFINLHKLIAELVTDLVWKKLHFLHDII